jgi:hypothetical protein
MRAMGEAVKMVSGRQGAMALALALLTFMGVGTAMAAPGKKPADIPQADAVLYEVAETMYLVDQGGNVVGPVPSAIGRKADAALYGWARVGNPLCPSEVLVTNPKADTCSVTAIGMDNLSLATFQGGVDGSFAVVVQDDNATDAAEYVVMNGIFKGAMDLSARPLGKIAGTFRPGGSQTDVPFCGTFRLPFSVTNGNRGEAARHQQAYYLADDFTTLIAVQRSELSLGMPTVRLELNFHGVCPQF